MSKLPALFSLCAALTLGACAGEPAKSDDGKADGAKAAGDTPEEPAATAEPAADTGPMEAETGAAEPAAGETGEATAGDTGETGEAAEGETGEAPEAAGETGEAPEAAAEDGGDEKKDGGDEKKGDDKKKGGDKKTAKADLELGKTMYMKKCKNCHAADGAGSEKFAKKVDHLPSLKKTKLSLAKVKKITMNGVPDTKMKGYKSKLSAEEIDAVAAFVKSL